jgi:phage terminase large subunit-like protein
MLAGRGWGKTRTLVEYGKKRATQEVSRGAIVAATAADARDIIVLGESGFLNTSTGIIYEPSKRRLVWPNGSTGTLFSAEEPDRLRGHQFHWGLADELAAWRYPEAWDMLMFGMRLGDNPQVAIATTPRPTRIIRDLMADEHCRVTRGSTYENRANLAPAFFDAILKKYEGTRLGRQEIEAEILDDVPGALWTRAILEANRVRTAPVLYRIVVAIDPAITAKDDSDETGIIVAGIDEQQQGYVLEDCTLRGSPDAWAQVAVDAYHRWHADSIVAEVNQGGDMVKYTLQTIPGAPPIKAVHAAKGKHTRAEPVSALYEQGNIHHVGMFAELEDQMCTWVPGESSPDRMDALVWAFTELLVGRIDPSELVDFVRMP